MESPAEHLPLGGLLAFGGEHDCADGVDDLVLDLAGDDGDTDFVVEDVDDFLLDVVPVLVSGYEFLE